MFKNVSILMLESKSKSNIILDKNKLEFINKAQIGSSINSSVKGFHLYFITNDKPKVNDYYICELYNDENEKYLALEKVEKIVDKWVNNSNTDSGRHIDNCKKVIATTDNSLVIKHNCECGATTFKGCSECLESLPKPSKSFIDKFISEYNKGNVITECLVEYDCDHLQMPKRVIDILKVDKNNEITIRKIKDSYTKDEVEKLAKSAFMAGYQAYTKQDVAPISIFDKWLKEEL